MTRGKALWMESLTGWLNAGKIRGVASRAVRGKGKPENPVGGILSPQRSTSHCGKAVLRIAVAEWSPQRSTSRSGRAGCSLVKICPRPWGRGSTAQTGGPRQRHLRCLSRSWSRSAASPGFHPYRHRLSKTARPDRPALLPQPPRLYFKGHGEVRP